MNFGAFTQWNEKPDILSQITMLTVFLKSEYWDAFSDGGELQWIKDPILLSNIAEAYNFIRMMLQLSNRYFEILKVPYYDSENRAINYTQTLLNEGVPNSKREISKALNAIEQAEKL